VDGVDQAELEAGRYDRAGGAHVQFSIPSNLKAGIDHVGSAAGPHLPLHQRRAPRAYENKKVFVLAGPRRGVSYRGKGTPYAASTFQEGRISGRCSGFPWLT